MSVLTGVTARVLFSIPFLAFGVRYLMHPAQTVTGFPIPGGVFWAYLIGLIYVLGGLAAITKIQGKLAMMVVAIVLLVLAFIVQLPAMMGTDATMKVAGTINFYKDVGLAGGALVLAGMFKKQV